MTLITNFENPCCVHGAGTGAGFSACDYPIDTFEIQGRHRRAQPRRGERCHGGSNGASSPLRGSKKNGSLLYEQTYTCIMESEPKPVRWVGSSRQDLKTFPKAVQRHIGQALYGAQCGEEYPTVKALKGFGGRSVLEIVASHASDTYRAVYTVRFAVTSCMPSRKSQSGASRRREKKSTSFISGWPQPNETTWKGGTDHEEENQNQSDRRQRKCVSRPRISERRTRATEGAPYTADLPPDQGARSYPGRGRRNSRHQAATRFRSHAGQSGAFSVERLMGFLTALGQDVEITVRPTRKEHGGVSVILA